MIISYFYICFIWVMQSIRIHRCIGWWGSEISKNVWKEAIWPLYLPDVECYRVSEMNTRKKMIYFEAVLHKFDSNFLDKC